MEIDIKLRFNQYDLYVDDTFHGTYETALAAAEEADRLMKEEREINDEER